MTESLEMYKAVGAPEGLLGRIRQPWKKKQQKW